MLDQALVGSVVTGAMAILSQAISKCKCHVACRRDETGEYCEPSCACGFLDAPLFAKAGDDEDSAQSK